MNKNLRLAAIPMTVLVAVACNGNNPKTQEEKANVILIYIDDMGYSDITAFGGHYTPTPNMDRIGREGILHLLSVLHQE